MILKDTLLPTSGENILIGKMISIHWNQISDNQAEIILRFGNNEIRERFNPLKVNLLPDIVNKESIINKENSIVSIFERLNLKLQSISESNI